MVAAFDKDREQSGDRARPGSGPGALEQPRQLREHGRRIALGGRRLAGGQADLALGNSETGDRIHQDQHVVVDVAEELGDRQCQIGGLAAHQRRLVRGRDDHHGAGKPGRAEVVLKELLHLAAALADQPDHRNVGLDVAGEHRQQHRFAHAGAGENAHALAAAAGREGIERPHAEIERSAHPPAGMGGRRVVAEAIRRRPRRQRALAVDRLAHRIDDPA